MPQSPKSPVSEDSSLRLWWSRVFKSASDFLENQWDQPLSEHEDDAAYLRSLYDVLKNGLSVVSQNLSLLSSASLLAGGLVFLFYFYSIGFTPDLNVSSTFIVLGVAITTGLMLIITGFVMFAPGLFARMVVKQQYTRRAAVLWYVVPLLIIISIFSVWFILLGNIQVPVWLWILFLLALVLPWLFDRRTDQKPGLRRRRERLIKLVTLIVGFVSFLPALSLVGALIVDMPHKSPYDDWYGVMILVVVVVLNFLLLIMGVFRPFLIACGLFAFLFMTNPTFFPNVVMHILGLGHFKAASLILDEAGCVIARYHGLKVGPPLPDDKRCSLTDVMIDFRLGSSYYMEVGDLRFIVPTQSVLSWSKIATTDVRAPLPSARAGCAPRTD